MNPSGRSRPPVSRSGKDRNRIDRKTDVVYTAQRRDLFGSPLTAVDARVHPTRVVRRRSSERLRPIGQRLTWERHQSRCANRIRRPLAASDASLSPRRPHRLSPLSAGPRQPSAPGPPRTSRVRTPPGVGGRRSRRRRRRRTIK
jgi:hypothetical protein